MAYYNEQGQVTIDEDAANGDISKIRQAITKLEDSQKSIRQLKATASSIHGLTGQAIEEQCSRLDTKVEALITKLKGSINFIQKTVEKYKEEDRLLAAKYRAGGGV